MPTRKRPADTRRAGRGGAPPAGSSSTRSGRARKPTAGGRTGRTTGTTRTSTTRTSKARAAKPVKPARRAAATTGRSSTPAKPTRTRRRRTATRQRTARTTTSRTTRRTATTTSRPAARPARRRPPRTVPRGQRRFVLEVPWELRKHATHAGASWEPPPVGAWTWIGRRLPARLAPFDSRPFSLERWKEDRLNGEPRPLPAAAGDLVPRPHQRDAIAVITAAYRAGRLGFVLADDVGLGKTLTAWAATLAIAIGGMVLICCPLSVIPHWRTTLLRLGVGDARVLIVNYERLVSQLLEPPPKAIKAKRRRTKNKHTAAEGTPRIHPDLVIPDEAHALRHPDSQRSQAMARLTANARFVLYLSATIGQDPLELAYLAPLLAQVTGEPIPTDKDGFVAWCQGQQVQIRKAEYGQLVWDQNDRDVEWMRRLLFDPVSQGLPAGMRRLPTDIAGWPEVQHVPMPVALDVQARIRYATAWAEFRRQLGLATRQQQQATSTKAAAKARENGRVAKLRFRQKCSLLRVPGTAQLVADQLDAGRQVFVSVEFHDTLDALRADLAGRGIRCAVITGKVTGAAREAERLAFQRGQVKVVLSTITQSINLHAGEDYDGQVLSTAPRVAALHDVRYSGLDLTQIAGRCNRDGQAAPMLWLYGEETAEEAVVMTAVPRIRTMKQMHGDNLARLDRDMEAVLEKAARR
jgi:SNF2-related domain